jgi:hypothetical protein
MLKYSDMLSTDAPLLLGVRLKPLSLGHILHLQAQDCAFISPIKLQLFNSQDKQEQVATLAQFTNELLLAVTICSMSHSDFADLIANRLLNDDTGKRISLTEYMTEWGEAVKELLAKDEVNILQSIRLFNDYIITALNTRNSIIEAYEPNNNNVEESSDYCDDVTRIVETLASHRHITTEEILDQPIQLTYLQYLQLGERNGAGRFISSIEETLRNEALNKGKAHDVSS